MLAHAAGMKNADVVNFYFFKLNSTSPRTRGQWY
jgi:hypothetical protein